jgi:sirohydrochlorin ferrochelatase
VARAIVATKHWEAVMVVEQQVDPEKLAAELAEHRGQWVAIREGHVVAAAEDPADVLRQVEERGLTGWVLDRVSEDPDTIYIL